MITSIIYVTFPKDPLRRVRSKKDKKRRIKEYKRLRKDEWT